MSDQESSWHWDLPLPALARRDADAAVLFRRAALLDAGSRVGINLLLLERGELFGGAARECGKQQ